MALAFLRTASQVEGAVRVAGHDARQRTQLAGDRTDANEIGRCRRLTRAGHGDASLTPDRFHVALVIVIEAIAITAVLEPDFGAIYPRAEIVSPSELLEAAGPDLGKRQFDAAGTPEAVLQITRVPRQRLRAAQGNALGRTPDGAVEKNLLGGVAQRRGGNRAGDAVQQEQGEFQQRVVWDHLAILRQSDSGRDPVGGSR